MESAAARRPARGRYIAMPRLWMSCAAKSGNAGVIITDASDFAAALAKTIETDPL